MRNKGQKSEGRGQKNRWQNPRSALCPHPSALRGFSLVELLIVIGIIVLVLALAVPALNLITGSKSTDAAQNQISVLLARARTEAVGVQEYRGVMFYLDPASGQVSLTVVQPAEAPTYAGAPDVDLFLDLTPEHDVLLLPKGVGAQVVDDVEFDAPPPNGKRKDDGYIGYNTKNWNPPGNATTTQYGGVILFDSRGQLASRTYAFKVLSAGARTAMGNLLYDPANTTIIPADVALNNPGGTIQARSAVGLIVFDFEAFKGNDDNTLPDAQIVGAGYSGSNEEKEERWLDQNGLPLLVNRYNGTLIKGD